MDIAGTPTLTPATAQAGQSNSMAGVIDGVIGTSEPSLSGPAVARSVVTAEPAGPRLQPDSDVTSAAAAGAVTGTWRSSVLVDALWCINEVRNAWLHTASLGWKKIFNGTDGAFTALTTLASQAKETGRAITFREEADGMVHEIYLW